MNRKLSTGRKTGFLLSALLLCFLISGTLLICESLKDKPLLADLCSAEGYHLYVEGQLVGAALTEDKVMYVGHLPHLGKLVSYLVADNEAAGVVTFVNGGVVCLARDGAGCHIQWYLIPSLCIAQ